MKNCINCGSAMNDGDNFCGVCGSRQPMQQTPQQNTYYPYQQQQPERKAGSKLFNTYIKFLFFKISFGTLLIFLGTFMVGFIAVVIITESTMVNDEVMTALVWLVIVLAVVLTAVISKKFKNK